MRIARGIIASCILSIISAADQQEEMRCKARPGCHLAKCDPGLLSPSLNANEYPVTCVRTSVQGGDEYNELKRNMQVLQAELNALRTKTNDLKSRLAKPNTALQIITRRSCDGVKLESALARNDSGGVFKLDIPEVGIKNVFCDIADVGGNWTVFQRRMNGDVDFYRNWDDYRKGFGDLQGDHWMGLEALHRLTKGGNVEMKIKMITRKGIDWVAKYRLHASGYSGNATYDALEYSSGSRSFVSDLCYCPRRRLVVVDWCVNNLNGIFLKTDYKGNLEAILGDEVPGKILKLTFADL